MLRLRLGLAISFGAVLVLDTGGCPVLPTTGETDQSNAKMPAGCSDCAQAPVRVDNGSVIIFDNFNVESVSNNGKAPCFTLTEAVRVTYITTYHWNYGMGKLPGTISLKDSKGTKFGPFHAKITNGQGGVAANWVVNNINLTLPAETYTIIDSDPATWSTNAQAHGFGFARLTGGSGAGDQPISLAPLRSVPCTVGYYIHECSGAMTTTFTPEAGKDITITATISPATSRPGVTLVDASGAELLNTQGVDNDNTSTSTLYIPMGTPFPLRLTISDCSRTPSRPEDFSAEVAQGA